MSRIRGERDTQGYANCFPLPTQTQTSFRLANPCQEFLDKKPTNAAKTICSLVEPHENKMHAELLNYNDTSNTNSMFGMILGSLKE